MRTVESRSAVWSRIQLWALLRILCVFILFQFTGVANAATINVTTTTDTVAADGVVSLREAFITANSNGEDDQIVLAADTAYPITDCAAGSLTHAESTELSLIGDNSEIRKMCTTTEPLIVQNQDDSTLVVNGIDLVGNRIASTERGAGISVRGASFSSISGHEVRLENSTVRDFGGQAAIYLDWNGEVELVNSHLTNNLGDGLHVSFVAFSMQGGSASNNGGSGVNLVDGTPAEVHDADFVANGEYGFRTTGQGRATLSITDSDFEDNGYSGVVCSGCANIDLDTLNIRNNGALSTDPSSSGGLRVIWQHDAATTVPQLRIVDSVIEGNRSAGPGGGIRLHDFALFDPRTTGGLPPDEDYGVVTITGSQILNNRSTQTVDYPAAGGGIWAALGNFDISGDTVISNNTAGPGGLTPIGLGGGIFLNELDPYNSVSSLHLHSVTMNNNEAGGGGGGIYYSGSNTVTSGGIDYRSDGFTTIEDSTISNNFANPGSGGGILVREADLTLLRTTINNNVAGQGAGITFGDSTDTEARTLSIIDSTVNNNIAGEPLGGGGGLMARSGEEISSVDITNSTFTENGGFGQGGAINFGEVIATLNHVTLVDNSSVPDSGAAIAAGAATMAIARSVIANSSRGPNCLLSGSGTITSGGFSFADDGSCGLGATDLVLSEDAGLGALADNGGPTLTHLPAPTAPVAGLVPAANCSLTQDQRGEPRPQGDNCEAGSVEIEEDPTAGPAPIMGTPGNDILFGTPGDDRIYGRGGNDIIFGAGGDDHIEAGPGNDWVFGGSGDDVVRGGSGRDAISGGRGSDELYGEDGNDLLIDGAGRNLLDGGAGVDRCYTRKGQKQFCEK